MSPIAETIQALETAFSADPSLARGFGQGVVHFVVDGHEFSVDTRSNPPVVVKGKPPAAPDVTLSFASTQDFQRVSSGQLSSQSAFAKGLLKLRGNMGLAIKFNTVLEAARRRMAAAPANAGLAQAADAAKSMPSTSSTNDVNASTDLKSDAVFAEIAAALERDSALAGKSRGKYRFVLASGGLGWLVDLSVGSGTVTKVVPPADPAADVTLTLSDSDMVRAQLATVVISVFVVRGVQPMRILSSVCGSVADVL